MPAGLPGLLPAHQPSTPCGVAAPVCPLPATIVALPPKRDSDPLCRASKRRRHPGRACLSSLFCEARALTGIVGCERVADRAVPGQVDASVGELGEVEEVLLVVDDRAGRSGAGVGLAGVEVDLSLADGDRVGAGG